MNDKKNMKWHGMPVDKIIEYFSTDPERGLTADSAEERLEEYGRNKLPEGKKQSPWIRFLMQFKNVLIYVLIAAAGVTALMDHWIDTWVILAVIIINALIGYIQEGKAEKALESIRNMLSLEAVVIRDGKRQTIGAEELVPGDIVLLKSGDKIPADIRLVNSRDLRVEESPLTGESTAVEKSADPVDDDAVIGDQLFAFRQFFPVPLLLTEKHQEWLPVQVQIQKSAGLTK